MANKPSDLFNGIPSVSELLDRPQVRALVDRWNRSAVAGGVRSFLDELSSDLQRRAADAGLPSIRELAERAAKHVIQLQQPSLRPAINATGKLLSASEAAIPLADQALERMAALGRGYCDPTVNTTSDAASALARLTGAEAATVVHSYVGAIWLAISAIAGGKEVVISRADTGDVDRGCSILSLATSAAVRVKEVGSANCASVAQYEAAISDAAAAALVKHEPDSYRISGDVRSAHIEELIALARDRELPLIHAVGSAPLVGGLPVLGEAIHSVAASIAAGAHLVIVRGNGLVGGPPCGMIIGHRDLVRRIEEHPLFAAWRLGTLPSAALAATLQLYDDRPRLSESLPVLQLLSASVDNLRQRAERLAPQLAQAPGIQSAEPVATENDLGIARFADQTWPSYAIALISTDSDPRSLANRLRAAALPVIGRPNGSRLVLDLRTVFPRQDQQIVDALAANVAPPVTATMDRSAAGL
jgi:L-seryl-tRNA(Ser) seleniumtransferase